MGHVATRKSSHDLRTYRPSAWNPRELLCFVWAYHRIAMRRARRDAAGASKALAELAKNPRPMAEQQLPEAADDRAAWGFWYGAVWTRRASLRELASGAVADADKNLLAAGKNVRRSVEKLQALVADEEYNIADFGRVFAENARDVRALRKFFEISPSALRFLGHVVIAAEHITRRDENDEAIRETVYWLGATASPEVGSLDDDARLRLVRRQVETVPELPDSSVGAWLPRVEWPFPTRASAFAQVATHTVPIILDLLHGNAPSGAARPVVVEAYTESPRDGGSIRDAVRRAARNHEWHAVEAVLVASNVEREIAQITLAQDPRLGGRHAYLVDWLVLEDFVRRVPWLAYAAKGNIAAPQLKANGFEDFVAQLDCWSLLRVLSSYVTEIRLSTLDRIWTRFARRSDLDGVLRRLEGFGVRREGFTIDLRQPQILHVDDPQGSSIVMRVHASFEAWLATDDSKDEGLTAIRASIKENTEELPTLTQSVRRQLNRAIRLLRARNFESAKAAFEALMQSVTPEQDQAVLDRWREVLRQVKDIDTMMVGSQIAIAHSPAELESHFFFLWHSKERLPRFGELLQWYVAKRYAKEHLGDLLDQHFLELFYNTPLQKLLKRIRASATSKKDIARSDRWLSQWRELDEAYQHSLMR